MEKELLVEHKVNLNKMTAPNVKVSVRRDSMPNLVGMIGKNVIPQLENLGYRVDYKGVGKIMEQFPVKGATIGKNQKIYLNLQN